MVKKILSKSEFARMCGVTPAAVTKACGSGILGPAKSGNRIDAGHPVAIEYFEAKTNPGNGVDPLYKDALIHCRETSNFTANRIQKEFNIGFHRAKSMLEMMKENGVFQKNKPKTKKKKPAKKVPIVEELDPVGDDNSSNNEKDRHVCGAQSARQEKKRAALDEASKKYESGAMSTENVLEVPENIQAFAHMTLNDLISKFGTDTAFVDWLRATKSIEEIQERRLKNAEKAGELISRSVVQNGILATVDRAFTRMLSDGVKTIASEAYTCFKTGGSQIELEDEIAVQLSKLIKPAKAKMKRVLSNA